MKNISKQIEENRKQLDIMKYLIDTDQYDYISILTDTDYIEIDRLICRGMKKDLAIRHVAIMREFKSLNIKPRMGIIYGTGKPNNSKFDLRILNKKNI